MAQEKVCHFLKYGNRVHSIFASNPEKSFSLPKDPQLLETFKNADLLLADGIGIVWAARILYGAKLDRVPGAEFIFDICDLAAKEGYGIFIYGAKEETNKKAVNKLRKQFKDLKVVGRSNGYVSQSGMPNLLDFINKSGAKILFLALGSPKQEKWFETYNCQLKHVRLCQCIGGTLDTIAGNVKRAPEFWQRFSLEWLYRLIIQPTRIKRQKILPLFVLAVLKDKFTQLISEFKLMLQKTPH
jgi:N-acetylglucosaminyldiphosphoundecaprenol N-acetyl-beta-D-mannosaminyltransferase